ncbi:MAG TPA: hypothetical protein VLB09_03020, partial [Nitrospiria bacterium]|nr:hypothetical protein [Nitrospiria bacterium]
RYGTLPIVRRTGGLIDTVTDAQPSALESGEATGFVFSGTAPADLVNAVSLALSVYANRNRWYKMVRRAMAADFSWERSAREYEGVYEKALEKAGGRLKKKGVLKPGRKNQRGEK